MQLQEVTQNSLFDHLVVVKDSEDKPYGVSLEVFKSWTDARFYMEGKRATCADHQVPETLFVIRKGEDGKLLWSVYAVHDNSVRFVEKDDDVVLEGISFGTAWPTEIKYIMSGTLEGKHELVIEYAWGYSFMLLDELKADLNCIQRAANHFLISDRRVQHGRI